MECMKWLPDVYRGEFYDFKNKQNELPISTGILCRVAISQALGTIRLGADQSSKAALGKSAFAKTCSNVLSFVKDNE